MIPGWTEASRSAARETEPRPEAMARVTRRVIAAWGAPRLDRAAFALLVQPRPHAAERVTRRVMARVLAGRAPRRVRAVVPRALAVATLLVASFLFFGVRSGERALAVPLASATPIDRNLTPEVDLSFQGTGEASGTRLAPRIRWDAGTLALDVEPNAGIALTVETPDGRAEVRGTTFSVTRDDFGTSVTVVHGSVAVTCLDGRAGLLGAGASLVCEPVRAAGMLSRAHALRDAGADPATLLAAIDRGLSLVSPGDATRAELLALRLDVLVGAGRNAEALAAAEAYLAEGHGPRTADVTAWANTLRTLHPGSPP
jgi:ferric-dicitrate binding protein FerR (iron transport regulator)